jgi:hypothetical protein
VVAVLSQVLEMLVAEAAAVARPILVVPGVVELLGMVARLTTLP